MELPNMQDLVSSSNMYDRGMYLTADGKPRPLLKAMKEKKIKALKDRAESIKTDKKAPSTTTEATKSKPQVDWVPEYDEDTRKRRRKMLLIAGSIATILGVGFLVVGKMRKK